MLIRKFQLLSIMMIALGGIIFTSCSDNLVDSNVDTQDFTEQTVSTMLRGVEGEDTEGEEGRRRGKNRKPCFDLVYPLTIEFADATTASVSSKEEFRQAVKDWFEATGAEKNADNRPSFVYPLQIELGEVIDVQNVEELKEIAQQCRGKRGPKGKGHRGDCFELVYPVTIVFADATTASAGSKEEFRQAVKDWFEATGAEKNADNRPTFQFPIEVIKDGETIQVASQEELQALKEGCRGDRGKNKCFDLVYPVSMDFDGETQSFASEEELKAAMRSYRQENGKGSPRPELVFPVTVEYEDGTQATANSREELRSLKEDCE